MLDLSCTSPWGKGTVWSTSKRHCHALLWQSPRMLIEIAAPSSKVTNLWSMLWVTETQRICKFWTKCKWWYASCIHPPTYLIHVYFWIYHQFQVTVRTSYITSLTYLSLRSKQPWEEGSGCLCHLIQSHYRIKRALSVDAEVMSDV